MSGKKRPKAGSKATKASAKSGRGPWRTSSLWTPVSVLLLCTACLGLGERILWVGALVRELSVSIACLAMLMAVVALGSRHRVQAGLLFTAACVMLAPTWPLWRPVRLTPEKGPLLHVVEATLAGSAVDGARVRRLFAEESPDVLAVVGATDAALRTLDGALPALSHRAHHLGASGDLAVWSRSPLRGAPGSAVLGVRVGKCNVQLNTVSVPSLFLLRERKVRASALAQLARVNDSARAVWLGALGSRPQAPDLSPLISAQRLRDTRLGHGVLASTPPALSGLGLATDHILVRGWIAVRARATRPPLGDAAHATLTATLELTEPRCR